MVFLPSRRQRSGVAGDAEVEADYTTAEGYRLGAWVTQQRYDLSNGALDPDVSPDSTESRGGNGGSEDGTGSADGADLDAVQLA